MMVPAPKDALRLLHDGAHPKDAFRLLDDGANPKQTLFAVFRVSKTSIRRDDLDLLCFWAGKIGQLALYLFVPFSAPNNVI